MQVLFLYPNLGKEMRMQFILQPVSAILPALPTVTSPSDRIHGAIEFFTVWIARIGGIVALRNGRILSKRRITCAFSARLLDSKQLHKKQTPPDRNQAVFLAVKRSYCSSKHFMLFRILFNYQRRNP